MLLALAVALAPTGDSQLRAELAVTPAGALELQSQSKRREVHATNAGPTDAAPSEAGLQTTTNGMMYPRATVWQHFTTVDMCALALLRLGWQVIDPTGAELGLVDGNLPRKLLSQPPGLPAAPMGVMQYSKSPTDFPGASDAWAVIEGLSGSVDGFNILPRIVASDLETGPAQPAQGDGAKTTTAAGANHAHGKQVQKKQTTTTTTTSELLVVSTTTSTTSTVEKLVEALEPCDTYPCRGLKDGAQRQAVGAIEEDPSLCTGSLAAEGYEVRPPPPPPMRAGFTLRAAIGERPLVPPEPKPIEGPVVNASVETKRVNISKSFENKSDASVAAVQFKKTMVPDGHGTMKEVLTPLPNHMMGTSCLDFESDCEARAANDWCASNPEDARELCCRSCGFGLVPIANDGFEADSLEAPQVSDGWTYVQGSPLATETSPELTDWRVQGSVALSKNGNTAWGGLDSGAGAAYVILVNGTIEQSIGELTVGQTYTIRFRDAANPSEAAPQNLVVKLRNETEPGKPIQEWQNEPGKSFRDEAVEFVAAQPNLVLSFENASPTPIGIFLDDVRILEGGVRETEPFKPLDKPVNADHVTYSEPPTFGEGF